MIYVHVCSLSPAYALTQACLRQAGHQALHIAVLGKHEDLVRVLLAEGADVGPASLVRGRTRLWPSSCAVGVARADCARVGCRAARRFTSLPTSASWQLSRS